MIKLGNKLIAALVAVLFTFTMFSGLMTIDNNVVAATDYTDQVVVDDWNILDSSGNPLSETNQAVPFARYQLSVSWSLAPNGGSLLQAGDTFKIALPKNSTSGSWSAVQSAWENFTDSSGTVLGQWRISGSNIEVVLGSNVANSAEIVGAKFVSGANSLRNGNAIGGVQNVTMGNVVKPIGFEKYTLQPAPRADYKAAGSASNSLINWYVTTGTYGVIELTTGTLGANYSVYNNVYVEDVLEGTVKDGAIRIYGSAALPVDLTTGSAANQPAYDYDVTVFFTKVTQDSGESYDRYKSRLNAREYGIYTDTSGVQTVVVNYGNVGANGIKYSDADANFASTMADRAIKLGYYAESDRANLENYFTTTYGDGNVISGNIAKYYVLFTAEYDKVAVDTKKTNTAQITVDGVTTDYSSGATLQGNIGTAALNQYQAGVFLYDEDTNELLPGATFKLQRYNDATSAFEDYSDQAIMTTDTEGFAQTGSLPTGTYRFVEVTPSSDEYNLPASQGYDSELGTVVSSEFTIASGDTTGHKIPVSNVKYKYDVIYAPGEYGLFANDEHLQIVVNSDTPLFGGDVDSDGNPLGEEGHVFVGWDKTISPTVTETVTYTAIWEPVVEPLEPVAPIDPVIPIAPIDPVVPVAPVDPVDPVEPVNPEVPNNDNTLQKTGGSDTAFYAFGLLLLVLGSTKLYLKK